MASGKSSTDDSPRTSSRSSRLVGVNSASATARSNSGHAGSEDRSGRRPSAGKRVRKAVNCQSCRNSKLKCDRNRPCSSCVLRGTTAMCYQGSSSDAPIPGEVDRIDPSKEFYQIRSSLSTLEKYFFPPLHPIVKEEELTTVQVPSSSLSKKTMVDVSNTTPVEGTPAPGMLGATGKLGLYVGPTSVASYLCTDGISYLPEEPILHHEYDRDLIELLPPTHIIDSLIDHYFVFCTWIYRPISRAIFLPAWQNYKAGLSPDRLVLATACILMAIAIRYLPTGHKLLSVFQGITGDAENMALSLHYDDIAKRALMRYQDETRTYCLGLVEAVIARGHYFCWSKVNAEETWSLKGKLMSIGTAMGLHRDPDAGDYPEEVAERRRRAWWYILFFERWESFAFERPLSLSSRHFNTRLPSISDPDGDQSGRLALPMLAMFRLSIILGAVQDDTSSLRPVPYESTLTNDRHMTDWLNWLPPEIGGDEDRAVRHFGSPITSVRRLGVVGVSLLSTFYHARFIMHRPQVRRAGEVLQPSYDIAVSCADKLISLAARTGPDSVDPTYSSTFPNIYRHLYWRPFHIFSTAMFFTLELVRNPDHPDSHLYKSCVGKALRVLTSEASYIHPLGEKAIGVLLSLAPLYSDDYLAMDAREREQRKANILLKLKGVDFPYF